MKTWEKRLIVALIALAFALLIYSYFTDKSVFYSPESQIVTDFGVNAGCGPNVGDECCDTVNEILRTSEEYSLHCTQAAWNIRPQTGDRCTNLVNRMRSLRDRMILLCPF
ncbi:MAG: hypothetical protein AABW79_02060 [Nanoarchaeota archaeon]